MMTTGPATDLTTCRDALARNGFDAFVAADVGEARRVFQERILPDLRPGIWSWGDSLTMRETGVMEVLLERPGFTVLRTFEAGVDRKEIVERRRQALLADLFLSGTNAITACGKLVNLDMIGNRTSAIAFGPKRVVLFIGRNKIVASLEEAFNRVRNVAAPRNARRHRFATPCAETGRCHDCRSPQRICNTWSIIDKCFPEGRIKVILIDQDLGL